jgi:CDP-diacylglycerol--glycerol-3-phosphate 3-phosphatidyltransferase
MVSYAKARAEGLGLECKTGLLARPERVVLLAIGLITGTVIWAVLLLAVFSNVTAIQRIVYVWRATKRSKHSVAASQPGEFSVNGHDEHIGPGEENSTHNRPEPIDTSEGIEPSVRPVHTSVPPFNTGVQKE